MKIQVQDISTRGSRQLLQNDYSIHAIRLRVQDCVCDTLSKGVGALQASDSTYTLPHQLAGTLQKQVTRCVGHRLGGNHNL